MIVAPRSSDSQTPALGLAPPVAAMTMRLPVVSTLFAAIAEVTLMLNAPAVGASATVVAAVHTLAAVHVRNSRIGVAPFRLTSQRNELAPL